MYKDKKAWGFATIIFIISTAAYILIYKSINFMVIINSVLLIVCIIFWILNLRTPKE